jgi:methoxymalonate biosynthesis acyl carrier protein
MDDTKEKIRAYLLRFFRNADLRDDTDIFAAGFVNSLMAMQLVMFVEKEFQISVEDEDLDVDNFRSVDAIAALVQRQAVLRA